MNYRVKDLQFSEAVSSSRLVTDEYIFTQVQDKGRHICNALSSSKI
jgi:hypothetical protein